MPFDDATAASTGAGGGNLYPYTNSLKVFFTPSSHLFDTHLNSLLANRTRRGIPSYLATLLLIACAAVSERTRRAPAPAGRGGRMPVPARCPGAFAGALPQTGGLSSAPQSAVPGPGWLHGHSGVSPHPGPRLTLLIPTNHRQTSKEISVSTTTAGAERPGRSLPAARPPARRGAVGVVLTRQNRGGAPAPAAKGRGSAGSGAGRVKPEGRGAPSARARRGAAATKPPSPRPCRRREQRPWSCPSAAGQPGGEPPPRGRRARRKAVRPAATPAGCVGATLPACPRTGSRGPARGGHGPGATALPSPPPPARPPSPA